MQIRSFSCNRRKQQIAWSADLGHFNPVSQKQLEDLTTKNPALVALRETIKEGWPRKLQTFSPATLLPTEGHIYLRWSSHSYWGEWSWPRKCETPSSKNPLIHRQYSGGQVLLRRLKTFYKLAQYANRLGQKSWLREHELIWTVLPYRRENGANCGG